VTGRALAAYRAAGYEMIRCFDGAATALAIIWIAAAMAGFSIID
jgi:hypothetical protein